jgi:ATP-dependent DNA helicase RecG
MTAKNPAFDKLYKILKLEADTGYRDKAMIGGLTQFAARWQQEAGDSPEAKQIADILRTYSALKPVDPRRLAISQIVHLLGMGHSPIKPDPAAAASAKSIEPTAELMPDKTAVVDAAPALAAVAPLTPFAAKPIEKVEVPPTAPRPQPAPPAPTPPVPAPPTQASRPLPEARDEQGNPIGLASPVTVISGIGPAYAEKLERMGVKTIRDLLYLFPRRYDDFSNLKPISRLQFGD